MAGLGKPMTQAAPAAPMSEQEGPEEDRTEAPGAEEAEASSEFSDATDEEQALLQQFTDAAGDVLYDPESGSATPQIIADLKGQFDQQVLALFEQAEPALTDSPQDSVAATAVLVTLLTDANFGFGGKAEEQEQRGPSPEEPDYAAVLHEGGKVITEVLMEMSEAAKIHDFNEQDIEAVWARGMSLYLVAAEAMGGGGITRDGLKREFSKLVEADKAGSLNKVLPGLPGGAPQGRGSTEETA